MSERINSELDLAGNLAKRRINVVSKIKDLHPEIADDIWGAVASQTNLELGDRISQFRNIVETKKKALCFLETALWERIGQI